MKKISILILVFSVFMFTSIVSADDAFDKGSKSLSGGFSYTHLGGDAYFDTDLLEITPSLSFATSRGTFFGVTLQYQYINQSSGGYSYSESDWRVGFLLDKYFVKDAEKIESTPYFGTELLFSNQEGVTLISLAGKFGILKMMSNSVGIDFGLKAVYDRFSVSGNSFSGVQIMAGIGVKSFIF